MIPVKEQPEPCSFDRLVRQPGRQSLNARDGAGKLASYWKKVRNELHAAYGGVCAYTCVYLVGTWSVDHFLPKTTHRHLAYEWTNYRLASQIANSRKGEHDGILDPFRIGERWFGLAFPACLVVPGPALPECKTREAARTIQLLKLNDDDDLVQERCNMIMYLRDRVVKVEYLQERYPFIAHELHRQDVIGKLDSMFRRPSW